MIQIKNIIFDWGGVITPINYLATINAFKQYGINDFENYYSQSMQSELFILHEKGIISPDDFRRELRSKIPGPITDDELDIAWSAMLEETPSENIELLVQAQKRYRTFLLSNTNSIHVRRYSQYLVDKFSLKDGFTGLFDEVYYSHEMGLTKPDLQIFNLVLHENKINACETLFIDDTLQNVISANLLGMRTIYLKHGNSLENVFGLYEELAL